MFKFGFRVETAPITQSKVDSDQPMITQSKLKKSIFVVKIGLFSSKVTIFGTLVLKQRDLYCDQKDVQGRLIVRLKADMSYFLNPEKYFAFDPFL